MYLERFTRVFLFLTVLFLLFLWGVRLFQHHHMYEPKDANAVIYVKLEGEVVSPGVVELTGGALLQDAIELCGGLTEQAGDVNLQQVLSNGDRISIPAKGTIAEGLLNLNTATLQQLIELPDIGEKTAQKILDYREKNGGFHSTDELLLVSGIGEKTYEKLAPLVTISLP